MTHTISKSNYEIVFQRQSYGCVQLMFVFFGLAIIFLGVLIPWDSYHPIQNAFTILFGILFCSAAYFIPAFTERNSPEKIKFDYLENVIKIEMANTERVNISFSEIQDFIIQEEKRSPSAANSRGINYIHYHINLLRKNGSLFTITSTTKRGESSEIISLLKGHLDRNSDPKDQIIPNLPSKLKVIEGNPITISFKKFKLELHNNNLIHLKDKTQSYKIENFREVVYTYSATQRNTNFAITICFNSDNETENNLQLLLPEFNPVEILQLEQWLKYELNKRKLAISN